MFLHQLESGVAYLGVFTKIRQVVADDRQVAFLWINPFHLTYFLYRTHVQRIATDRINRVGRINDKAAVLQDFDDLVYFFLIRILRIDSH